MKVTTFEYTKDNGETTNRELLVLEEGENFMKGIDLSKLGDEEKNKLLDAARELSKHINENMSSFRNFTRSKMKIDKEESY